MMIHERVLLSGVIATATESGLLSIDPAVRDFARAVYGILIVFGVGLVILGWVRGRNVALLVGLGLLALLAVLIVTGTIPAPDAVLTI